MDKAVISIQFKMEAELISSSSPPRTPGAVHTKIIAWIAFEFSFRRSTYLWKANDHISNGFGPTSKFLPS
jgi:hypothetical protein